MVNNHIYINFDTEYYPDGCDIINRVFVNYNHDIKFDADITEMTIKSVLSLFI